MIDKELRLDEYHQYFKSRRYNRRLKEKKYKSMQIKKEGLITSTGKRFKMILG